MSTDGNWVGDRVRAVAESTRYVFFIRVATKISEGFGEALSKEFIKDQEPLSSIHYTRPGTCINRRLTLGLEPVSIVD